MTYTCSVCSRDYTDDTVEDSKTNPQHDELIKHLRGHNTVVINAQHGGFGLSRVAQLSYLERSGIKYTLKEREDQLTTDRYGPIILVNGNHWYNRDIERNDPVLVSLIEELGKESWGEHARLKLVQIPADVKWQIEEYDGLEWVSEQHRTWD